MLLIYYLKAFLRYLKIGHKFKKYDLSSLIVDSKMLTPDCISIGKSVIIWYNCRIEGVKKYNNKVYTPSIVLSDGVRIQQGVHITCANQILIGKNTCISANVTITDINHPYSNTDIPIERQDIEVKEVFIGEDSKIYNGAVILPGVKIGKHVCIGANSVVNKDIPDYSIAVGAPARVVKKYNFDTKKWEKITTMTDILCSN